MCPTLGSRSWIDALRLTVVNAYATWYSWTGQVAGSRVDYLNSFSFLTVRDAGGRPSPGRRNQGAKPLGVFGEGA